MINKKQFAQIYDDNVEKIYRFIYLKINSKEDAQDLTSETFLKLLNHLKINDPSNIGNIRAFTYQIARNLLTDYYREKSKAALPLEEELLKEEEMPQLGSPDKAILIDSDIKEVSAALKNIKEEYADLITWRYLEDLSIAEIAKITGKNEGNIRVGLHRALNSLRKEIQSA